MKTERNQLASVGRLHIWSLSDALPEKEVFQSGVLLNRTAEIAGWFYNCLPLPFHMTYSSFVRPETFSIAK